MAITMEQIKDLREKTGISVMQCRKALEDAGGDMEKAIVILQKKGAEASAKKADRVLKSSRVVSYIHGVGTVGVLVDLASESDFVSKHEEFQKLAYDIAMQIAATNPQFIRKADINEEEKNKVKNALMGEVEGKPEAMKEKILEGKLDAFFKEKILMEQEFIKDPSKTITALIDSAVQKFGEKIEIIKFVRFAANNETNMCE